MDKPHEPIGAPMLPCITRPMLTTTGPLRSALPSPLPTQSGPIRYYEGHEPEYVTRRARWAAQRREVRARWHRVYDPVHARAEGRTQWAIELHAPVFGYSDVGPPADRPHCGACWPDSYTGAPRDWPCEPFRDLRRQVAGSTRG